MDYTINTLRDTLKNSNAIRGWIRIEPLGVFQTSGQSAIRYEMPSNLPDRVVKFWRLQKPRERELIDFLNIVRMADDDDDGRPHLDLPPPILVRLRT
jgi:hypothetical protein